MGDNSGSFVRIMESTGLAFPSTTTTAEYIKLSTFLREENPYKTGLCGLMFPCLEDGLLAKYYEQGEFSIERNVFLSLHSGLGIDTYPLGIDESPTR